MMQPPQNINFPIEETKVLDLWDNIKPLQISLEQSKDKPNYGFYDGPPFATGLPHYGHILAGTIKDIITRFAHQNGYHVDRRFGWDCHGLPIEYEIDKLLEIKGPEDVLAMGIDKYNNECRGIAMKYSSEWRYCINRLGRWIDFDNDYKTLYPSFMESVWWVFKQLYHKGLVYRGFKVMPFSTGCHTPLSNFESGLNYKDVSDPAVTVSFPLVEDETIAFLAWTTTPWTLPSNCFLCVNPAFTYVKLQDEATGKFYILLESRIPAYFKPDKFKIIDRFTGDKLKGKRYKPIFPFYSKLEKRGFFQVLVDGYITEETGTGVVHQAPYFGEDDYRVALEHGLIQKQDADIVCPVDDSGRYTAPVADFKGLYVKDADKLIIKQLKDRGRLFHQATVNHNYPFCWRSETPLIYKAVPSWFVRVERFKQALLDNNAETYWVPNFVKEKRFANWLKDARDWAISRNRYWGTPIPLWVSPDGLETHCFGSIKELEEMTGRPFKDIHREHVDNIEIPSIRPGKPPLRRVSDVFDCWFESGSMPYAQQHVPFFIDPQYFVAHHFPADFIAEGIDQTRGWFYTLLVLGTLLFGEPPFKNLICNGLVLASDGQKMSKRKKNYPDPMEIIDKYGSDALRLYLINSPVVRGDFLKFKEEHVFDILKEAFLPWYNAYRFLVQNIELWQNNTGLLYSYDERNQAHILDKDKRHKHNIMDLWILSYTNSLIQFFYEEMEKYRLYTVVPKLLKFIDNLTNWYVRFNRKRLKGEQNDSSDDCKVALDTLFTVIFSLCRMMAPFTPFLTEYMYQNLKKVLITEAGEKQLSIHLLMLPKANLEMIDKEIEKSVEYMQTVIELGRVIRDRKNIPIKYPLNEVVVIHNDDQSFEGEILKLKEYIVQELNVKHLSLTKDREAYNVRIKAEPDHKTLGAKYKTDFKRLAAAIKEMNEPQISQLQKAGTFEPIPGCEISPSEVRLLYSFENLSNGSSKNAINEEQKYEAASQGDLLILLDVSPDENMLKEGYAREIINRIQKLRKKANLLPLDEITLYYKVLKDNSNIDLTGILDPTGKNQWVEYITDAVKRPLLALTKSTSGKVGEDFHVDLLRDFLQGDDALIIEETTEIKGCQLYLAIVGSKRLLATRNNITTKTKVFSPDTGNISTSVSQNLTNGFSNGTNRSTGDHHELVNGDISATSNHEAPIPFDKFFNVVYCNYDNTTHKHSVITHKATILANPKKPLTKNHLENDIRLLTTSWGTKLDIFLFAQIALDQLKSFYASHALNPVSLAGELKQSRALAELVPKYESSFITTKLYTVLPWNFISDEILADLCSSCNNGNNNQLLGNDKNYIGTILVGLNLENTSAQALLQSYDENYVSKLHTQTNKLMASHQINEFLASTDYWRPFCQFVNLSCEFDPKYQSTTVKGKNQDNIKLTVLRENPKDYSTVSKLTDAQLRVMLNLDEDSKKITLKYNNKVREIFESFGDLTKHFGPHNNANIFIA